MEIITIIIWICITLAISTIAAMVAGHKGVEYLIGIFAGAVVVTAVIANKVVTFGPFTLSASIIVFSVTFFLTDVISEFWGKKEATKAVWAGFLADILLLLSIQIAVAWQPASFWNGQEAFVQTLGTTTRIAIASLVAYILAQNHDVWAFHFWKKKTRGKYLWLRNNLSTGVSQVIDSVVFVTIGFLGIVPVIPMIISTIIVKFIIAGLDTPFIYLVKWRFAKTRPRAVSQ